MAYQFIPTFGKSEKINLKDKEPGRFYVATDTGEMSLDISNTERILVGGNGISVFYGTDEKPVLIENDLEEELQYTLNIDNVRNSKLCKKNDLILNSDGCFYKILSINKNENVFICSRIVVSGGGAGGGNSSILYANAKSITQHADGFFHISVNELEDNITGEIPVDALIINSDGSFYRVVKFISGVIYCNQIAVGGSGGPSLGKKIYVDLKTKINSSKYINGQPAYAIFTPHSGINSEGTVLDNYLSVTWRLATKNGNEYITYATDIIDLNDGESFEFDFGSRAKETAESYLFVEANGIKSGISESQYFKFQTMDLTLEKSSSFSNENVFEYDKVTASVKLSGNMDKILDFYFDNMDTPVESIKVAATDPIEQSYKFNNKLGNIEHGYHTIKIAAYQSIQGERGIGPEPIIMEIAVATTSADPIIWLGEYKQQYYSYDDIRIPYYVYDRGHTDGYSVTLLKNNAKIGTREFVLTDGIVRSQFEITDAEIDIQNYYSIVCGDTRRDIYFKVVKDPNRNMELQKSLFLTMNFDAKGRSNDESATSRQTLKLGNVNASFDNFNWYNNGWVNGVDGNTCLRISNGASLRIPIDTLTFANGSNSNEQSHTFEFQFRIRNVQSFDSLIKNITRYKNDAVYYKEFYDYIKYSEDNSNEYDINANYFIKNSDSNEYEKIIINSNEEYHQLKGSNNTLYIGTLGYKTKYTNYDAFLKYYADLNGLDVDEITKEYDYTEKRFDLNSIVCGFYSGKIAAPVGFGIGPQDAFFTNGKNTVNASYVEDKLINLTIVYNHSNKLMSIYINGILTGAMFSTLDDPFTINSSAIVFNSDICDIDLYKFRVYNTALSINDIGTNYAVDLKDVKIYDQNSLAIEDTAINEYQFDYQKMLDYNEAHPEAPIMPYIIYDTTNSNSDGKTSYSKANKLTIDVEFVNTGLDRAFESGEIESLAKTAGVTPESYYLHHCPSFTASGVEMAVQGTSSQYYPRRNFKLKTDGLIMHKGPYKEDYIKFLNTYALQIPKEAEDHSNAAAVAEATALSNHIKNKWFYMDNDTYGTTKFTMKIDFMESSGSYNRGLANLLNNAYSKHPLEYYNAAEALGKYSEPTEATTFTPGTTYYYFNHNGNIKSTDGNDDNIPHLTAETFAQGPNQVYEDLMVSDSTKYTKKKVADNSSKYYNKWYSAIGGYVKNKSWSGLNDLRTTVQGFPVLAFHKHNDTYTYIGRYNMLTDKGSDETYGFKYGGMYLGNLDAGAVSDLAECWEFENNSRGFCSFRDPLHRKFLSFNTNSYVAEQLAPSVVEDFEYRYNSHDKALDILAGEKASKLDSLSVSQLDTIKNATGVEPNTAEKAQNIIFDLYSNWEKAVQWVWSTSLDGIIYNVTYDTEKIDGKIYYRLDGSSYTAISNLINTKDELPASATGVYYCIGDSKKYTYNSDAKAWDEGIHFDCYEACPVRKQAEIDDLTDNEKKNYLITEYKAVSDSDEFEEDKKYYEYSRHLYIPAEVTAETWKDKKKNLFTLEVLHPTFATDDNNDPIYYDYDSYEYREAKFRYELEDHFNLDYLATYFVVTEVLELYDSRGKNAMFASWGPMKAGGEYVWFPIFYDMDTQLGINNTGIPSFEYYIDATDEGTFSTNDSVLWNNFYRVFKGQITEKYCQLKGMTDGIGIFTKLDNAPFYSVDRIEAWYESDPNVCNSIAMRGERPISAINLDEYYKYISITNGKGQGYLSQSGNYIYDNTSTSDGSGSPKGSFFYALQGDRALSRQQFLTNRFNYIDSWLGVGAYAKNSSNDTSFWGRIAANNIVKAADGTISNDTGAKLSDIWVDNAEFEGTDYYSQYFQDDGITKTHDFDGEWWLTFTPTRKSYVRLIKDDSVGIGKYIDTPVQVEVEALKDSVRTSTSLGETLFYILGIDILKSMGNLHNLYFTELHTIDAKNLTDLILGWDGKSTTDPDKPYKNYGTNAYEFSSMPLVKEINLSNIQYKAGVSTVLDFTNSEKLENFRATGSNFTQIKFAPGVALNTLYLPTTITELKLTEARQLKNVITKYEQPEYIPSSDSLKAQPGLYIEHFTDYLDDDPTSAECICNIDNLSIINAENMGYDSYKLLNGFYKNRKANNASVAKVAMTDVLWSPYKKVDAGTIYNNNKKYFTDNFHFGFNKYTFSSQEQWETDIKNGVLYVFDDSYNTNENQVKVTDLAMLEDFVQNNMFISPASGIAIPNITGIIYIDNDSDLTTTTEGSYTNEIMGKTYSWNKGDPVDESYVRNVLNQQYPGITFFFKNLTSNQTGRFIISEEPKYELVTYQLTQDNLNTGYYFLKKDETNYLQATTYDSSKTYYKNVNKDIYQTVGIQTIKDDDWFINPIQAYGDISDLKANYDFNGWSYEGKIVINKDSIDEWDTLEKDKNDYTFYADFELHKQVIKFYNYDQTLLKEMKVEYNTLPGSIPDPEILPIKPYTDRDYSGKDFGDLYKCYVFAGWSEVGVKYSLTAEDSLEPDFNEIGNILDFNKVTAAKDHIFIANFKEGSVYDSVLPERYLTYDNYNEGVIIRLSQAGYATNLSGKVCLPSTIMTQQGKKPVLGVTGFSCYGNKQHNITHIFLEKPSKVEILGGQFNGSDSNTNGFRNSPLEYIEIPSSCTILDQACFHSCSKLGTGFSTNPDLYIRFFNSIREIRNTAVYQCKVFEKIYLSGDFESLTGGNTPFSGSSVATSNLNYIQIGTLDNPLHNFHPSNTYGKISNVASSGEMKIYVSDNQKEYVTNYFKSMLPTGWKFTVNESTIN